MIKSFFNLLFFQACWFACIVGAARGSWLPGVIAVVLFAMMHLFVLARENARVEIRLMSVAFLLGVVADGFLASFAWVRYFAGVAASSGEPSLAGFSATLPPPWILALWIAFALTINHSMNWAKTLWQGKKKWLVICLGALFGPLAYLAGERMGALILLERVNSLAALAVIWGMAFPLLVHASLKFERTSSRV